MSDAAGPAVDPLRNLNNPGHACAISEHGSEYLALIARFARLGLERAEQCIYLHAEGDEARLVQALRDDGIDVDAARASNALVLVCPRDANLKGDALDAYRLFTFWKKLATRARTAGFTAIRCAITMSSFALGADDMERWHEYEAQLTELAHDQRCLFLCHYDRRALKPDQLLEVVRRHTSVIHSRAVDPNAERARTGRAGEPHSEDIASERRLGLALAACAVPFTILSAERNALGIITDFTWQYLNPAAEAVVGGSADELLGTAIQRFLPRVWSSAGLFECLVKVADSGQPASCETSFAVEGTVRWWLNLVSKLDEGVAVWLWEITERKQAEEQQYRRNQIDVADGREAEAALRTSQAALARVSRLTTLGELSTSIAHEVNQPLGAIILHGDAARLWLARTPPNVTETLRAVEGMMGNAHRARDVIARIRALASKADQPHERLDVNEIVRDVLELTRCELQHSGILVRTELDEASVRGDRVQLQQVLLNLVMNAIEAMNGREGGPRELRIRTARDAERGVRIEIRDSGIGVSPDALAKIFEPFYTTKSQGIGIGLSISRSIVEAHGGRLWAERRDSTTGLSVHMTLPSAESPLT